MQVKRSLLAGVTALGLVGAIVSPAFADTSTTYQVQSGDTLLAIAAKYGVVMNSLAASNGLTDANQLAVGETLTVVVPGGNTAAPSQAPTSAASPPTGNLAVAIPIPGGSLTPDNTLIVPGSASGLATLPYGVRALPAPTDPLPLPRAPIIAAPYFSQFDGSAYAESNCGPTSLAMALGGLHVSVGQLTLRQAANAQMGSSDPNIGTTWEALAYAAKVNGVSNDGLYGGSGYRSWSIDDLKNELSQGRPVLLLVRYWDLPGHGQSGYAGDHYIVALGFDQNGNLVSNDPASYNAAGAGQVMTPAQLTHAWSDTSVGLVRTAMALYR
ncbi:MAG TPA: C39 family peptidase [Chloroflexota bacterium]|nr:C39 family peptidase [Chloroflexota bacterium]